MRGATPSEPGARRSPDAARASAREGGDASRPRGEPSSQTSVALRIARRLVADGSAQAGGCRPCVYRLGTALGLDGSVPNDDGRVILEVAGPPDALAALAARLRTDAPPQARVTDIHVTDLAGAVPAPGRGFRVEPSSRPAA